MWQNRGISKALIRILIALGDSIVNEILCVELLLASS